LNERKDFFCIEEFFPTISTYFYVGVDVVRSLWLLTHVHITYTRSRHHFGFTGTPVSIIQSKRKFKF
jgi:hypothetical protein